MKTKIKEVQEYFKNKLISGDFKIDEVDQYVLKVTIDDEYKFSLWIGNWQFNTTRLYDGYYNFIMFDLTEEEGIKLKNIISPEVESFWKNVLIERKRKELAELENEIK